MKKKNNKNINSTTSKFTVLHQLCNLIPPHLVSQLAREHKSEDHARTFSHWSQVVSLIFAKLTHSFGLNDVCDTLGLYSGPLSALNLAWNSSEPSSTWSRAMLWFSTPMG